VAATSRVLADLCQEGYPHDADAEAALSPYLTTHLTRFGRYSRNPARVPAALEYDGPILSAHPGHERPRAVPHELFV
jgi:hypothetical protein